MTILNITDVKDLVSFLHDQGVHTFEGFGLKLEFRPDGEINPFQIKDEEERKKAVMEAFQKQKKTDEEDLLWST